MQINPLILYGFMMLFLINPIKTCYYKSRFWLLKLLVSPLQRYSNGARLCLAAELTWLGVEFNINMCIKITPLVYFLNGYIRVRLTFI